MTLTAAINAPRAVERRFDRAFYCGMSFAVLAAVLVGFAPTYYLRPYLQATPLPLMFHVHGFVFTCWVVLFIAQTTLIAARQVEMHRRLGWAGAALAALMVAVGLTAGIVSLRRDYPVSGDAALTFLTTPMSSMAVFLVLVAFAVRYRRRTETHKRLMLVATISVLDAAVARWPLAILATSPNALYVITDGFILTAMGYDLASRRRVHPAYFWGGLLVVTAQFSRNAIGETNAWHAFARMLV